MELREGLIIEKCIALANTGGSYAVDIETDDIEVSDTVTVVWGIE